MRNGFDRARVPVPAVGRKIQPRGRPTCAPSPCECELVPFLSSGGAEDHASPHGGGSSAAGMPSKARDGNFGVGLVGTKTSDVRAEHSSNGAR